MLHATHIFRDHWHHWCDLHLEDEIPADQRAHGNSSQNEELLSSCRATAVCKTIQRPILGRDPNGGYARYACPG